MRFHLLRKGVGKCNLGFPTVRPSVTDDFLQRYIYYRDIFCYSTLGETVLLWAVAHEALYIAPKSLTYLIPLNLDGHLGNDVLVPFEYLCHVFTSFTVAQEGGS